MGRGQVRPIATRIAAPIAAAVTLLLGACAAHPPQTIYAWGSYEDLIYTSQVKPGSLTPRAEVDVLQKDRELARAANKPLPPGWHAYLGYLYFEDGEADLAKVELDAEKAAFPESATFVDQIFANLARRAGAPQ